MKNLKSLSNSKLTLSSLIVACLFGLSACDDTITVNNSQSGEEIGLLVDGNSSGGFINDGTYSGVGPVFSVGDKTSGSPGEAILFSNFRPVAIEENISWTDNDDDVTIDFQNEINIPVTVWIVKGPFSTSQTNAINMCITTSSIWDSERMGVSFSQFQIIDATSDPDASTYHDFDCSMKSGIESDIGKTAGRINIYVVETVDGGAARGNVCQIGSDFVAIATAAGTELLSHELGHNFGLLHIDGQATFDQTNILHSASNTREFITEGQLFRAHFLGTSAINDTYNARPGQPTRTCGHNQADNSCPTLNKRIWADGTFPAN